ncbi:heparinase II/III family protein [Echinicola sp. CAU 1574]|uniref:Heparinase II/III family protein n=1 Tax=Echinicola arenosa TaxID=2774144 RepID=A0ABR9AGA5_9BACT|nr:heparinase II/III family protein [Echinicola arenosa]MBD8487781.1 heparinase II/III family protein [Echinicola arenosa]
MIKRIFVIQKLTQTYLIAALLMMPFLVVAQEKRDLLQKDLKQADIDAWVGVPEKIFPDKASLKNSFEVLPEDVLCKIQVDARKAMEYEWPSIPVSAYLDFVRNGDRTRMQSFQNSRISALKSLVLAELSEQEGNYLDPIADGVWAICEQSTWVLSAHLNAQKDRSGVPDVSEPVIDLGAGEVANLLAWIHFYFRSELENISPLLVQRIETELDERIISPYLARNDFWWMGFDGSFVNNWNPWCNYNVLLTTFLVVDDQRVKQEVYKKSIRSVDQFINYYKSDGACEEGPAYWDHAAGKMLEYLELIQKISNNEIYLGDHQLIQKMGNYIRKTHIQDEYFVNFADASASLKAHPGIIYRYGKYISDDYLKGFAADIALKGSFSVSPFSGSMDRMLHNLCQYEELLAQTPYAGQESSFLYPETEIIGGRSTGGFFFAAKGGHNNESHNHNDVGSFILYFDGRPVLIDIGVEIYSAKTFSGNRYEIWTMQSDFHNLPKINGFSQKAGKIYKGDNVDFDISGRKLKFNLDISKAYPTEAKCEFWNRSYEFDRKSAKLEIREQFELKEFEARSELHFMCFEKPVLVTGGVVKIGEKDGKSVLLKYPSNDLSFEVEEWEMEDSRLQKAWTKKEVFRLVLKQEEEKIRDEWQILVVIE